MPENCPHPDIADFAQWYASLHDRREALRDAGIDGGDDTCREVAISDAMLAIETLIEVTPAATVEGAVVKVMLAHAYCEAVQVPEDGPLASALQRIQRLLVGAVETIGRSHRIDVSSLAGEVLLPTHPERSTGNPG